MRFKNWLEQENFGATVQMPSQQASDPRFQQTVIGSGDDTVVQGSHNTLQQVVKALEPLGFNSAESGFHGTPDFASPEQVKQVKQVGHTTVPDTLSLALRNNIPNLFPQLGRLSNKLLRDWKLFKDEVLKKLGNENHMSSEQQRPIHFALPLKAMQDAGRSFQMVSQILSRDNSPELREIKGRFQRVYAGYQQLSQEVTPDLTQQLTSARQDPRNYESGAGQ